MNLFDDPRYAVLILVLMEYGLRLENDWDESLLLIVLILVLMEYGLRLKIKMKKSFRLGMS